MRWLMWILVLALSAVGLATVAEHNPGYVLIVLPSHRIELSLNFLIVILLAVTGLLYAVFGGIGSLLNFPEKVRQFKQSRQRERQNRAFHDAVRCLFEGRYGHALKKAEQAYDMALLSPALPGAVSSGMAALVAARSAQFLKESQRQTDWMERAESDPSVVVARLMMEAEYLVGTRQYAEAVARLNELQSVSGRHIAAMRLELKACQGLEDWNATLRLARQLEKRHAMPAELKTEICVRAHEGNLQRLEEGDEMDAYLRSIPAGELRPRLALKVARQMAGAGHSAEARQVLESQIELHWDEALLDQYGRTSPDDKDTSEKIAVAERWLKERRDDYMLLLTLGRLCMAQRLWGKAESYIEASLAVSESVEAHIELAHLFDQLGRTVDADRQYRAAALTSKS